MQRRLDTLAVAPMPGFTVASCSDFTFVVDPRSGTELLDEDCHGVAVEAFTEVIETDPLEQPLEMAYRGRSLVPYESGRLEEAVSDDSTLMGLSQDDPDFLPADAQLLPEAHAMRTTARLTSGDFKNAETDLRTVIAIPPEDHEWSQREGAWRAQTGEMEPHASQQSSSACSVDTRCIGSHVARHSGLRLLSGPRAASASGAKADRGDEL